MEFQTQQYLRSGKTLEDLSNEYGIKSHISGPLVMLNYSMLTSDLSQVIPRECRALLLELGTWNVVCRSFNKFSNYGEPTADVIDWSTAIIYDKLDGSLVTCAYYNDSWIFNTRSVPYAETPVGAWGFSYLDLIKKARESFCECLDKNLFYSFELTSPYNRNVVEYPGTTLTLLASWDRETLDEVSIDSIDYLYKVNKRDFSSFESVLKSLEAIQDYSLEGYVIKDGDNHRIKVKSPLYIFASKLIDPFCSPKKRLEAVLSLAYDDLYPTLPNNMQRELLYIQESVQALRREVLAEFVSIDCPDRKEFAQRALQSQDSAFLFCLKDGAEFDGVIRRIHTDKLVERLGL